MNTHTHAHTYPTHVLTDTNRPLKCDKFWIKVWNLFQCSFWSVGINGFPHGLKQTCSDPNTGGVTFVWRDMQCEQVNGILLGYEVKLYYGEEIRTKRVLRFVTNYTILPRWKDKYLLPNAISVAAINEVGVGDHSPPVNIIIPGACKN